MNTNTIAARRKHIQDTAPCTGCGASLAVCEANRGKDPTAPPWFGCCSTDRGPCSHVADQAAFLTLLREIEAGHVRTVEEITPKPPGPRGMSWFDYLNQDEVWHPQGRPPVRIADMDREWRYNASRWLERRARGIAWRYEFAEAIWFGSICASPLAPGEMAQDSIEQEMTLGAELRHREPVGWIQQTPLYEALVAGLPTKRKKLARLAARARHYSTCPVRLAANKPACCSGSGFADYAAVPCPAPTCPVGRPCTCPTPVVPEWTLS